MLFDKVNYNQVEKLINCKNITKITQAKMTLVQFSTTFVRNENDHNLIIEIFNMQNIHTQ